MFNVLIPPTFAKNKRCRADPQKTFQIIRYTRFYNALFAAIPDFRSPLQNEALLCFSAAKKMFQLAAFATMV